MQLTHIHYNLQKHYFTNWVIDVWKSLPNEVVSADFINIFKSRLDQFWCNQGLKFDRKAEISGFGSRSLKFI